MNYRMSDKELSTILQELQPGIQEEYPGQEIKIQQADSSRIWNWNQATVNFENAEIPYKIDCHYIVEIKDWPDGIDDSDPAFPKTILNKFPTIVVAAYEARRLHKIQDHV